MGDDRKRVEIRLPEGLVAQIDEIADAVGMGRSSFVSVASAMLVAKLQPVYEPAAQRKELVDALSRLVEDELMRAYGRS